MRSFQRTLCINDTIDAHCSLYVGYGTYEPDDTRSAVVFSAIELVACVRMKCGAVGFMSVYQIPALFIRSE